MVNAEREDGGCSSNSQSTNANSNYLAVGSIMEGSKLMFIA